MRNARRIREIAHSYGRSSPSRERADWSELSVQCVDAISFVVVSWSFVGIFSWLMCCMKAIEEGSLFIYLTEVLCATYTSIPQAFSIAVLNTNQPRVHHSVDVLLDIEQARKSTEILTYDGTWHETRIFHRLLFSWLNVNTHLSQLYPWNMPIPGIIIVT